MNRSDQAEKRRMEGKEDDGRICPRLGDPAPNTGLDAAGNWTLGGAHTAPHQTTSRMPATASEPALLAATNRLASGRPVARTPARAPQARYKRLQPPSQ
ncbi:hypothetical protein TARUN_2205 [Trichoderma arundinaceum]|uniref:Uncharacterized protein n=1 Tax=Trichoderma arundinaceum TaxID=490622 RepID=A0A395NVG5_TRIAR|nr:hypothetical protein TARUN_2205 [Trichoderma arundinaceum]